MDGNLRFNRVHLFQFYDCIISAFSTRNILFLIIAKSLLLVLDLSVSLIAYNKVFDNSYSVD